LLDRVDLGIDVPALPPEALVPHCAADDAVAFDTSAEVRSRVSAARERQLQRQGRTNARLSPRDIDVHCVPDAAGAALLAQAMARLSLSARAYHRILKVARTIADLAAAPTIAPAHIAEAVGYRRFERESGVAASGSSPAEEKLRS
jgi:magnesium chelatase family protein